MNLPFRSSCFGDVRSLLSILMGFSSACQAKAQAKVVEDVDSIAAWTSNLIFQVLCRALEPCRWNIRPTHFSGTMPTMHVFVGTVVVIL